MATLELITLVSYIYSEFFCTKTEAFNSTFARIWQFMAGMIVCCMRERETETTRKEMAVKYTVLTLMVWIVIHPRELPVEVLRWYLTLSNVSVLTLCISLFSSSIFLLEYNRVVDYLNDPAVGARLDGLEEHQVLSFEEVSKIHRKWSLNDYRLLYAPTCAYDGDGPLGWCRHTVRKLLV
ncbi:hypothetical protein CAEBREN_07703 [Caenorhabditis brenneri]|uniref:Uncharacterized protein n=1 Tax=Caenorhabditis brenneri TaxID=135651 RepID=G0MR70_CAEBE|nr:hypothetical protein CAEBREN_07703 [Caenorhabditis brenneri]